MKSSISVKSIWEEDIYNQLLLGKQANKTRFVLKLGPEMVLTEKEIWREILIAYKDLPCLWKPTDDNYYARDVRQKAVDFLLSIYRKLDPNATGLSFKKRLENMRTSYNREKKKVRHSFFTEPDPEKRHKPTLWYYDLMKFLDNGEDKPGTKKWEPLEIEILAEETGITNFSKQRNAMEKTQNTEKSPPAGDDNSNKREEQSWEIQGRAIGCLLNELKEDQKIIAEKLISEVIFYGKLGKLTDTAFVAMSRQTDEDMQYSDKYVNLGTVECGSMSPSPSNHSPTDSSHSGVPGGKNKLKPFKPKILIVKRIKEE